MLAEGFRRVHDLRNAALSQRSERRLSLQTRIPVAKKAKLRPLIVVAECVEHGVKARKRTLFGELLQRVGMAVAIHGERHPVGTTPICRPGNWADAHDHDDRPEEPMLVPYL